MAGLDNLEIVLDFACSNAFLYRIVDLPELPNLLPPEVIASLDDCHIYLICKRPRVSIVPGSPLLHADGLGITLQYSVTGVTTTVPVLLPRAMLAEEEVRFEVSEYPHREFRSFDQNGRLLGTTLLANLVHIFPNLSAEAKDVEVVYIGKGLKDNAQDRLASHDTLQKILADVHSNEPDSEVFILTYAFADPKKNLMGTPTEKPFSESERLQRRTLLERAARYNAPTGDWIALIEASLISYFQTTEHNVHYLTFPTKPVDALEPLQKAGFAGIGVSIDNSGIGKLRVFSKRISPSSAHSILIPLNNSKGAFGTAAAAMLLKALNADPASDLTS